MIRFIAKRLLHTAFLLLGVSCFSFLLLALSPGDYLSEMLLNPNISHETIAALQMQYGLRQSVVSRYMHWLGSVLHGGLGYSFSYNSPVGPLLWSRACNTLLLTATSLFAAWVLAFLFGIPGAKTKRISIDTATSFLLSIPDPLLALGLLAVALHSRRLLPVGGILSRGHEELGPFARMEDLARHMLLPVLALSLANLPLFLRHVRASVRAAWFAPEVLAARAHGLKKRRVFLRYVLPAAVNPLISIAGMSFGSLLSVSLLVEVIFSWPGMGPLLLQAIFARDIYLIIGAVLASATFMAAGNLMADILLAFHDPRIREGAR